MLACQVRLGPAQAACVHGVHSSQVQSLFWHEGALPERSTVPQHLAHYGVPCPALQAEQGVKSALPSCLYAHTTLYLQRWPPP